MYIYHTNTYIKKCTHIFFGSNGKWSVLFWLLLCCSFNIKIIIPPPRNKKDFFLGDTDDDDEF